MLLSLCLQPGVFIPLVGNWPPRLHPSVIWFLPPWLLGGRVRAAGATELFPGRNLMPLAVHRPHAGLLVARHACGWTRPVWGGILMGMDQADQQDVAATLRGDGRAYERLVRRHQQQIAIRMWRFTHDRADLEELVHDVFVEAYMALGGYKGRGPFAHWLNRIATRVGYRFWKRRRKQAQRTVPLRDWDVPSVSGSGGLEAEQAGKLLRELLDRLPPRDRLVLTLMYLEEMSVSEVAEQVGWSMTMVKVQAHRARRKLRALLESSGLSEILGGRESAS